MLASTNATDDEEVAAIERAVEDLQADDGDTTAYLRERAEREKRKALAVQSQRRLWEAGLEVRILLQRLLKSAVRLPQVRDGAAQTVMMASCVSLHADQGEGVAQVATVP